MKMKGMSLFANVGIAEALLSECNVEVVLANELVSKRVEFYKHVYPNTEIIEGDITNKEIFNELCKKAKEKNIDFIIATPPCQGMSTVGKKEKGDIRNQLVTYAIEMIKKVKPKYVLLENVPEQLKTHIIIENKDMLIPDYIKFELDKDYIFNENPLINCAYYGVAQNRERSIFLLTRRDQKRIWEAPEKESIITLEKAIGDLPILDPIIYDIPYEEQLRIFPNYERNKKIASEISKWHVPPSHVLRQVLAMRFTPSGQSAFNNENPKHRPLKADGTPVKGFKNTYKRQSWDKPAYTVTMYNRTLGSEYILTPSII